jgi:hypothetical protein
MDQFSGGTPAALKFPVVRRSSAGGRASYTGRAPLLSGSYSEVTVIARRLGWTGRLDCLTTSNDEATIIDFKTGAPVPEHESQLKVYALLWHLDQELNPSSSRASTLLLSYSSGKVEVPPPSDEDLRSLEEELRRRTETAQGLLALLPPAARPGSDKCPTCQVRQMCDAYWADGADAGRRFPEHEPTPVIDCALNIMRPRDSFSWEAIIEVCPGLAPGANVTVRGRGPNRHLLTAGRVRALAARMEAPDTSRASDGPSSIVFDHSTEVFWQAMPSTE